MCHGVIIVKRKDRAKPEVLPLETEAAFNLRCVSLRSEEDVESYTTFIRSKKFVRQINWDEKTYGEIAAPLIDVTNKDGSQAVTTDGLLTPGYDQ